MVAKPNPGTDAIRQLIDRRLKTRLSTEVVAHSDDHIDDDLISAFVEGRLDANESAPLISHLVKCSACRYTTAQLVRLESQVDHESEPAADDSPGRMRSFIDSLTARITPPFEEDAVFAYQNPEPEESESADGSHPEKLEDDK
jgi:hypothetical protein